MKKVLFITGLLLISLGMFSISAKAQSGYFRDISLQWNGVNLIPNSGAQITICASTAVTVPCFPTVSIYSNAALTVPETNPITTALDGSWSFYATPGQYVYTATGTGLIAQGPILITVVNSSGGGGGGGGGISSCTSGNLVVANSATTGNCSPPIVAANVGQQTGGVPGNLLEATGANSSSDSGIVTSTLNTILNTVAQTNVINTFTQSQILCGPSPRVDVDCYGARQINPQSYTTTGTISSSSHSLSVVAAVQFHNGDGISIYGAGATNTLSTPSAPTVTPSQAAGPTGSALVKNAPSGSTSYSYKCVALGTWSASAGSNLWGAYTVASTAGSTSIGNTLGLQAITITSESETAGVVTVVATGHGLVAGVEIQLSGTSNDGNFGGSFTVNSVIDANTFTYLSWYNTPTAATATGGTLNYYNENRVTCPSVPSGGWGYAIYGRTSAAYDLIGQTIPGSNTWDDFGSPLVDELNPYGWLPFTAPAAAQNGVLTTTISSGGGTTALTLVTAASNSTSGSFVTFDDVPAIRAAMVVALNSSSRVYFPVATANYTYVIGSYFSTSAMYGYSQAFDLCGILYLDDPMEIDGGADIGGSCSGSTGVPSQGIADGGRITVNTAYPGLYGNSASALFFDKLKVGPSLNTYNNMLGVYFNGGDYLTWNDSYFTTNNDNTDYMGRALLFNGVGSITLGNDSFEGGPAQSGGPTTSTTGLIQFMGNSGGWISMPGKSSFNRRGIVFADSATALYAENIWDQGPITPFLVTASPDDGLCAAGLTGVTLNGVTMDSSSQAVFGNLCGKIFEGTVQLNAPAVDSTASITGAPIGNLVSFDNIPGQKTNTFSCSTGQPNTNWSAGVSGQYGQLCSAARFYSPQPNPGSFFLEQEPGTPVSTLQSGGSLTIGTPITYKVNANFPNGGTSSLIGPSNSVTPTSGNQTVSITWAATPGASSYTVWRPSGALSSCHLITSTTCVDDGSGTGLGSTGISGPSDGCPSMGPNGLYSCFSVSPIYGTVAMLDQTGVSTANSGSAQNILASTSAAGKYRVSVYADESAGCTTVGSGALTVVLNWTDATHGRVSATLTLTPGTAATGTGSFVNQSNDIWAAASSAITVTDTYVACMTGTWTYDQHATVERLE